MGGTGFGSSFLSALLGHTWIENQPWNSLIGAWTALFSAAWGCERVCEVSISHTKPIPTLPAPRFNDGHRRHGSLRSTNYTQSRPRPPSFLLLLLHVCFFSCHPLTNPPSSPSRWAVDDQVVLVLSVRNWTEAERFPKSFGIKPQTSLFDPCSSGDTRARRPNWPQTSRRLSPSCFIQFCCKVSLKFTGLEIWYSAKVKTENHRGFNEPLSNNGIKKFKAAETQIWFILSSFKVEDAKRWGCMKLLSCSAQRLRSGCRVFEGDVTTGGGVKG